MDDVILILSKTFESVFHFPELDHWQYEKNIDMK